MPEKTVKIIRGLLAGIGVIFYKNRIDSILSVSKKLLNRSGFAHLPIESIIKGINY